MGFLRKLGAQVRVINWVSSIGRGKARGELGLGSGGEKNGGAKDKRAGGHKETPKMRTSRRGWIQGVGGGIQLRLM